MLVALSLLLIAIFTWLHLSRRKAVLPLPPMYPGALPFIGHAHKLIGNNNSYIMNLIREGTSFCMQNGGVIRGVIGSDTYYVITDPEDAMTAANTCLQKHFSYGLLGAWLGNGLITRSSDTWKPHRKLINPAFSLPVINNFLPLFNSKSQELLEIIKHHDGQEPFDMMTVLGQIVMETSCLSTYGMSIGSGKELQKFTMAVNNMLSLVESKFQKVWLHSDFLYHILGYKAKEEKLVQYLHGKTAEAIRRNTEDRINLINPKAPFNEFRSFMDVFLDSPSISSLKEHDFMNEVDTALAASFDTTWSTLIITLVIIGSYPDVQEKIYQEITKVVGKDKNIEKEDLPKLVYTDAVIKESLRWMPPVQMTMRYVDKDVKLRNYTMQAGSNVVLLLCGINNHGWNDAEIFRPERWLEDSTPNTFASFSIGKRSCIGKTYAMASMKVTIGHLVRAFKLTADVTQLVNRADVTAKPIRGHEIKIEGRN